MWRKKIKNSVYTSKKLWLFSSSSSFSFLSNEKFPFWYHKFITIVLRPTSQPHLICLRDQNPCCLTVLLYFHVKPATLKRLHFSFRKDSKKRFQFFALFFFRAFFSLLNLPSFKRKVVHYVKRLNILFSAPIFHWSDFNLFSLLV